jgi:hypothetical protein
MAVSTSAQLLSNLQLDDFIYGVVGSQATDVEEQDTGVQLWNIPGLGVLGIGAATVAVVAAYVANPAMKEDLQTVADLFGGTDRDAKLDTAAELVGKRGEETNPTAPPKDGEPRVAAETVKLLAPKAEPGVDVHPAPSQTDKTSASLPAPKTEASPAPTDAVVSRGYQVQSGMPLPSGPLARPSAEINQVLQNTAKTEGVDYRTLYALGGAESSFSAGATAKKSSATGLFQFTAPTWTYLTQKVYPELGYVAGDRLDPQKSAIVAARYVKSIKKSLAKKLGREPSIGETYLGYFMGPTGASSFLEALGKNPNAKGADVFPKVAEANPYLFYHKGDKTKPLTLADTMSRLDGKITAYYEQAGQVQVAKAEVAPPVLGGPQPIQVKAKIVPSTAAPQVVAVPAPDFTALKGGAKGEARDQQAKGQPQGGPRDAPAPIATSGPASSKEQKGEVAYVRDKQGRLITIRSS